MTIAVRWVLIGVAALAGIASSVAFLTLGNQPGHVETPPQPPQPRLFHQSRLPLDTSGFQTVSMEVPRWSGSSTLDEIASLWYRRGYRLLAEADERGDRTGHGSSASLATSLIRKASLFHYEGDPGKAYRNLEEARAVVEKEPAAALELLYTIIFYQGVSALRLGETENCVLCRGESSCILPIAPTAVHAKPAGSRLAIRHFSEYLDRFPSDVEVQWLLNLAHMTLGEYPARVDPHYLISLDRFNRPELGIGKFRDIGDLVGINRSSQSGGAIMDDFDNDGLLDLVFTSSDPSQPMVFYRNKGDGTFEDRTETAGLARQLGGLNCIQTDYNNDGFLDLYIIRGAWLQSPIRPSLLRNNGDGTFTDVTAAAGLLAPVNSIAAAWSDYDNDGFLDLFVCCERQPNRLYRNRGNGTFEEAALRAGVAGNGKICKGAAWIDFDRDGWPDLFVTHYDAGPTLYRNNGNGTFTDVTAKMGIDGPRSGFACWAWDYDNDGWPDLFVNCTEGSVEDVIRGLTGKPNRMNSSKLFRNMQGKGFQDVTAEVGLDSVFMTMGCNFGDFDNDGFPDMYLGTGGPGLTSLVPNRMIRNLGGKRFVDITGSSGTGHLQKGHGVACGDWDRDGNVDIAIQLGGATPGDRFHNALFQNPGQGNNSVTVKLVGVKSNRAAIGARIKAVTAGGQPLTVYRHVSSGGSFGANPLEQTIGVGKANRLALLEVSWPTSGTTQTFLDVAVDQVIEIAEFATEYRKKEFMRIPVPKR